MTVRYPLDLHVHSVFSDGLQSPAELCARASKLGLTTVALCDHDTTGGLAPMAEAIAQRNRLCPGKPPLVFLPAMEWSSGPGGRTHVLGYGANPASPALRAGLAAARTDRRERAERILAKIKAQGIVLSPEALARLNTPAVGRAHIARELVACGAVHTMAQAFQRYLAEGKSCYEPRKVLAASQAVELLRDASAVPVLAHPLRLGLEEPALYMLIQELREAGLRGLEAYHPSADAAGAARLAQYAQRNGLLVTGGSDFHGDANARVQMGHMPAGWHTWREDAAALENAVGMADVVRNGG